MQAIHRKMFRELWQMRWQCLAIALVLAAGVATITLSTSTLNSLLSCRAQFYAHSRFGHIFAHLKRAPLNLVARIRDIDGVQAVEPRVVTQVTLSLPSLTEPAGARILSLPERGDPQVCKLFLRSGRLLQPHRTGEVLVSEAFAEAHQYHPGDSIQATINGKSRTLRIVGIVLSPEFVYSVRPGELLPDDRRYGVLWMGYEELSAACDQHDAFNDLAITLTTGASESGVLAALDDLIAAFGGSNAYGRDLQPSHRFLENELIQLRTMAFVPPGIFMCVTIFLLQVVMSRLVRTQREQIAMMRAFGYTQVEIVWHFTLFAVIICVAGVLIGVVIGANLGAGLTAQYTRFFRFPVMTYRLDWWLVLATSIVALAAAIGAVWNAVWSAALLPPAQAMQPEAPPMYHASISERIGLQPFLSPAVRMILRHLERWPLRSVMATIGIALSIGILVMGNFVEDTVDHVMDFQFHTVGRHDLMVTFVEPTTGDAISELKHLQGVRSVEPFRASPVRLVNGQHHRRMDLIGLPKNQELNRVVDSLRGPMELPLNGLVISRRLAAALDCQPGDPIKVESLEGLRIVQEIPLVAVVDDYLDMSAYMELNSLWRLLREENSVSGAAITTDALWNEKLYRELKEMPRIAGVSLKSSLVQSYERTMAENLLRMKLLNVIFACVVAVGVVYNCARISLAERSRELATLRVLGYTRGETARILLGELMVLVTAAIPLGLLCGYGLAWLLCTALNTELHRFPLIIHGPTYAFAIAVVLVATLISSLIVRRRMDNFNLVEVLKARD